MKQTIDNTEFDEWCQVFYSTCKKLGYKGRIDPDSMTMDYNNELDATEAATSFVEEMNS
jgi:hypothetical protein